MNRVASAPPTAKHVTVIDKTIRKVENGEEIATQTKRMFIVSLQNVSPEDVRRIVAGHWHIEMDHWQLDIQLRKDSMTSKKGQSMEFGAMLRRMVLVLWKHWRKERKDTLRSFLIQNQASTDKIEQLLLTGMDSPATNA